MPTLPRTLQLVLVLTVLAGCSKPGDRLVGHWDGRIVFPEKLIEGLDKAAPGDQGSQLMKAFDSIEFDLDLRADGTYSGSIDRNGESEVYDGTWKLDEKAMTVTINQRLTENSTGDELDKGTATDAKKAEGRYKPVIAQLSKDWKTLKYTDSKYGGETGIVFTKR